MEHILHIEHENFAPIGSSAGIGRATALLLAKQGARLTIHGRSAGKLQDVADEVEKLSGHKPVSVIGNIEDQAVRNEIVEETLRTFGTIHGLVNNAGYATAGCWQVATLADMQLMMDIHVLAPFDLCQRCLPQLIDNKGNIVMVSSMAGSRGVSMKRIMNRYSFRSSGVLCGDLPWECWSCYDSRHMLHFQDLQIHRFQTSSLM